MIRKLMIFLIFLPATTTAEQPFDMPLTVSWETADGIESKVLHESTEFINAYGANTNNKQVSFTLNIYDAILNKNKSIVHVVYFCTINKVADSKIISVGESSIIDVPSIKGNSINCGQNFNVSLTWDTISK